MFRDCLLLVVLSALARFAGSQERSGAGAVPELAQELGSVEAPARGLLPYPKLKKGERSPFDLWRYGGREGTSFARPHLPMSWEAWLAFHAEQKPLLMKDVRRYMASRYEFRGRAIAGVTMSGGRKLVMAGPIACLPEGIANWEDLASLSPEVIRAADLFPYKPLAHPLQTTAHMLFAPAWIQRHPEHERIDVDLDIPEEYLPEFPLPMFLTTHKELGDVTRGAK